MAGPGLLLYGCCLTVDGSLSFSETGQQHTLLALGCCACCAHCCCCAVTDSKGFRNDAPPCGSILQRSQASTWQPCMSSLQTTECMLQLTPSMPRRPAGQDDQWRGVYDGQVLHQAAQRRPTTGPRARVHCQVPQDSAGANQGLVRLVQPSAVAPQHACQQQPCLCSCLSICRRWLASTACPVSTAPRQSKCWPVLQQQGSWCSSVLNLCAHAPAGTKTMDTRLQMCMPSGAWTPEG